MGMEAMLLKQAMYALKGYLGTEGTDVAEKAEKTIVKHALAAAAAAVASGWIPGAGSAIATTIAIGFVWAMYYNLSVLFKIPLKKNILKTIASVVVAEAAAYVAVILVASAAIAFIPGVGNISASIFCAAVNFGMVYAAGIIFIQMMTKVFKTKKRAEDLSEMEWRDLAKNASGNVDMKAIFNEAKSVQKKAKNNDEYGDYKDVKPFEDK